MVGSTEWLDCLRIESDRMLRLAPTDTKVQLGRQLLAPNVVALRWRGLISGEHDPQLAVLGRCRICIDQHSASCRYIAWTDHDAWGDSVVFRKRDCRQKRRPHTGPWANFDCNWTFSGLLIVDVQMKRLNVRAHGLMRPPFLVLPGIALKVS